MNEPDTDTLFSELLQAGQEPEQALPVAYEGIGRPALAPLRTYLFDRTKDMFARGRAAEGLKEIAERDPSLRGEAVEALVRRLDPEQTQEPEDETLNAFVIGDLL